MKVSIKRFWVFAINFIILLITFIFMYSSWNVSINDNNWVQPFSVVAVLFLLIQICSFKLLHIRLTDFRHLFVLLLYVFLLGRFFVYAMGQENNFELFFYRYTNEELYKTAIFSLCFIYAIFWGLLFFTKNIEDKIAVKTLNSTSSKTLFYTGILIFFITFPCDIYRNYLIVSTQASTDSYIAAYQVDVNGVVSALAILTIFSVICIVCSKVLMKRDAGIIVFLFIGIEMIISVFSGARGYTVIGAIVLLICYKNMYNIIFKAKAIIPIIILGYFGACFISAIGIVRNNGGLSISSFISQMTENAFSGKMFYYFLNEFGNTQSTVSMGIKCFDGSNNFYYGSTWLFAWLSVIPGIYAIYPQISLIFNPIDIIKQILPWYYMGGSLALDAYINFEKFGIVVIIIFGAVLSKIMEIRYKKKLSSYAIYYGMYYIFLRMVRCGVSEILRLIVYMLLLYFIVNFVVRKVERRGE